jgi:Zn-dependent M16 (insulinase) family peptidase
MGQWLYGADPARALFYEESLKKMREGLDNGFFEDLIRRCLIDNPHQLLVTLRPSTTMAKEREEHTAQLLAARKAAMTKEEIQDIIDTTAHLKEFQQTPDTAEQLAMIPLLKLSDIRKEAEELPLEGKDVCGVKVLYSDVATHGIAYLGLYTNIDAISEELQPYAYFLVSVLGGVDTKEHNYTELTNLENLCSGGIAYNLTSFSTKRNEEGWDAKGTVKMRALVRKLPEAAKLLNGQEQIRVATKYPKIARDYFNDTKNQTVEIIKLNGSIELAPIVGLAEVIVDIVETGSTLRENGLTVLEEVCPLSARMVVNPVSMRMENARITKLLTDLNEVVG